MTKFLTKGDGRVTGALEIIRRQSETPCKCREKTEIVRLAQSSNLNPPSQPPSITMAAGEVPDDVVDLFRGCAVHDGRISAARYIKGNDGKFRYAQSIRVTESLYRLQYEANQNAVGSRDITDQIEECAWCGATGLGPGPIHCPRCEAAGRISMVCWGKTVGMLFRCCRTCGMEGHLVHRRIDSKGLNPHVWMA
jgi:hypothetical protein